MEKFNQSARSLPIWSKAISHIPSLRTVINAVGFCRIIIRQEYSGWLTREERDKVGNVALGGRWE